MFGKRLKQLRYKNEITQAQLSQDTGVSISSISMYENGNRVPELETFELLADYFNVDMDYLKGKTDIERKTDARSKTTIKVYGKIPAGNPIEAIEDIVDEEEIPREWTRCGHEYIALRVSGDSMYPKFMDGDVAIIRLQDDCESGQDAVIYINGYDVTLKTVIKQDDGMVRLQPANPQFKPKIFKPENIKILGIVKRLRRDF